MTPAPVSGCLLLLSGWIIHQGLDTQEGSSIIYNSRAIDTQRGSTHQFKQWPIDVTWAVTPGFTDKITMKSQFYCRCTVQTMWVGMFRVKSQCPAWESLHGMNPKSGSLSLISCHSCHLKLDRWKWSSGWTSMVLLPLHCVFILAKIRESSSPETVSPADYRTEKLNS